MKGMDLLAIVLVAAFIVWLLAGSPPAGNRVPPWGSWAALAVTILCLILMALGVHVETAR